MSREKKELTESDLKTLMRLNPTLEDTAAFFECNPRTIERYIEKHFELTFVEFRKQNMVHTRLSLIRKAIQQAESGNTAMLIFCLKNLCKWKDKHEEKEEDKEESADAEKQSKARAILDEVKRQLADWCWLAVCDARALQILSLPHG